MPSDSFISLFAVESGAFSMEDYKNHIAFFPPDYNRSQNLQIYKTLMAFKSFAVEDDSAFSYYGKGIASALGETGSVQEPAVNKIFALLYLAGGGELPDFD